MAYTKARYGKKGQQVSPQTQQAVGLVQEDGPFLMESKEVRAKREEPDAPLKFVRTVCPVSDDGSLFTAKLAKGRGKPFAGAELHIDGKQVLPARGKKKSYVCRPSFVLAGKAGGQNVGSGGVVESAVRRDLRLTYDLGQNVVFKTLPGDGRPVFDNPVE